jgi:hypothetical protein
MVRSVRRGNQLELVASLHFNPNVSAGKPN